MQNYDLIYNTSELVDRSNFGKQNYSSALYDHLNVSVKNFDFTQNSWRSEGVLLDVLLKVGEGLGGFTVVLDGDR